MCGEDVGGGTPPADDVARLRSISEAMRSFMVLLEEGEGCGGGGRWSCGEGSLRILLPGGPG